MAIFGGKKEESAKKIILTRDGHEIVVKDAAKKAYLKSGWRVKK